MILIFVAVVLLFTGIVAGVFRAQVSVQMDNNNNMSITGVVRVGASMFSSHTVWVSNSRGSCFVFSKSSIV